MSSNDTSDERLSVDADVEAVVDILGANGTEERRRIQALFNETADPGPLEIFRAAAGKTRLEKSEDEHARMTSSRRRVEHFDPAEDPAQTSDRIGIKNAYEGALEAGEDEWAEFFREASPKPQREFATFLMRGGYLPGSG